MTNESVFITASVYFARIKPFFAFASQVWWRNWRGIIFVFSNFMCHHKVKYYRFLVAAQGRAYVSLYNHLVCYDAVIVRWIFGARTPVARQPALWRLGCTSTSKTLTRPRRRRWCWRLSARCRWLRCQRGSPTHDAGSRKTTDHNCHQYETAATRSAWLMMMMTALSWKPCETTLVITSATTLMTSSST